MTNVMIDLDRWDWCDLCGSPYIMCDFCMNTSCNGGGCDKCSRDFNEAIAMVNKGTAPKLNKITKRQKEFDYQVKLDELFKGR